MLYVDSCIPMYLVGAEHPHKKRVLEVATNFIQVREQFLTSAEAFQEIIHRYKSRRDFKHLTIAYQALEEIVAHVEPVSKRDTDLARTYAAEYPDLSSRDCLHAAVMKRLGCKRIWTFDMAFSQIASLTCVN